jgi:hypothetical protein
MLLQFNGVIYRCEMLHYQIFHPSTRPISLQCWTSTESGDAVLISKMTAASLWTFRILGIKKHVISVCVYLHLYVTYYAWQYENTLSCDVATFTSFFVWICELEVWQPQCDKIAITHMFVSATVFFCNRSTSAVCNHTVKNVCNHLYFHQVATTSSKDQTSHIKLFTSFLQSQSHCYKGCNHTATCFAIAAHQSLQTYCKVCCNQQYFDQVATHQPKTTLVAILQCRGTELFF